MKKVVCNAYGEPSVLKVIEGQKPLTKDDEILIKIICSSVTVRDRRIRAFDVPKSFFDKFVKPLQDFDYTNYDFKIPEGSKIIDKLNNYIYKSSPDLVLVKYQNLSRQIRAGVDSSEIATKYGVTRHRIEQKIN